VVELVVRAGDNAIIIQQELVSPKAEELTLPKIKDFVEGIGATMSDDFSLGVAVLDEHDPGIDGQGTEDWQVVRVHVAEDNVCSVGLEEVGCFGGGANGLDHQPGFLLQKKMKTLSCSSVTEACDIESAVYETPTVCGSNIYPTCNQLATSCYDKDPFFLDLNNEFWCDGDLGCGAVGDVVCRSEIVNKNAGQPINVADLNSAQYKCGCEEADSGKECLSLGDSVDCLVDPLDFTGTQYVCT
jgi:hypothetical protein